MAMLPMFIPAQLLGEWSAKVITMIFRQILLTSSIRNVWRTVRRICIFISGLKGLTVFVSVEMILSLTCGDKLSTLCPRILK